MNHCGIDHVIARHCLARNVAMDRYTVITRHAYKPINHVARNGSRIHTDYRTPRGHKPVKCAQRARLPWSLDRCAWIPWTIDHEPMPMLRKGA